MGYVLFFAAVFALSGPGAEAPRGFETLADCEALKAKVEAVVAARNASPDPDKIVAYAIACLPHKPAVQGKEL